MCAVLESFPNTSIVLEQIRVFKTNAVAELTGCQDTQHRSPDSSSSSIQDVSTPVLSPLSPPARECGSWARGQGFDLFDQKLVMSQALIVLGYQYELI